MDNVANVFCYCILVKNPAVTIVCHLLDRQNNLSIFMLTQSPPLATEKTPLPVSFPRCSSLIGYIPRDIAGSMWNDDSAPVRIEVLVGAEKLGNCERSARMERMTTLRHTVDQGRDYLGPSV